MGLKINNVIAAVLLKKIIIINIMMHNVDLKCTEIDITRH